PTRVSPLGSTRRRSGAPGSSRWSWPTTSSSDAGRIRTARGASGRTAGVPASSAPTASKRSTTGAYVAHRPGLARSAACEGNRALLLGTIAVGAPVRGAVLVALIATVPTAPLPAALHRRPHRSPPPLTQPAALPPPQRSLAPAPTPPGPSTPMAASAGQICVSRGVKLTHHVDHPDSSRPHHRSPCRGCLRGARVPRVLARYAGSAGACEVRRFRGAASDAGAAGAPAHPPLPPVHLGAQRGGAELPERHARGQRESHGQRPDPHRRAPEDVGGLDEREHRGVDRQSGEHRRDTAHGDDEARQPTTVADHPGDESDDERAEERGARRAEPQLVDDVGG